MFFILTFGGPATSASLGPNFPMLMPKCFIKVAPAWWMIFGTWNIVNTFKARAKAKFGFLTLRQRTQTLSHDRSYTNGTIFLKAIEKRFNMEHGLGSLQITFQTQ